MHAMAKKIFPPIVPPSARVSLKKGFRLASKSGKYKKKKKVAHNYLYCCKISSPFNLVPNGFLRFGENGRVEKRE